jgi:diguanylate cyclase (GGDEF)-like protein/PAS domain S-box-containing protein
MKDYRKFTPRASNGLRKSENGVRFPSSIVSEPAIDARDDNPLWGVDQALRAQAMLDFIGDAVLGTDTEGQITFINQPAEDLTGFSRQEALGKPLQEVFRTVDATTGEAKTNLASLAISSNKPIALENNTLLLARDGQQRPIEDSAAPIHSPKGEVIGAVIVFHDSDRSLEITTKMAHLAQHDSLTGVMNRNGFAGRFEQARAQAERHQRKMILLFIDLDDFKDINDIQGHSRGDMILKSLAKMLMACVRTSDIVCRYGGDEFVVLLSDIEEPEQAVKVVDKVREAAARLSLLNGNETCLKLSIGVSVYPEHGENLEELLPHADAAMYRIKAMKKQNRLAPKNLLPALVSKTVNIPLKS